MGTTWHDRLLGGVFGHGLAQNARQGYRVLAELYEEGDAIFLAGFSRGAYTARTLAGFIRNSGLLRPEYLQAPQPEDNPLLMEAYALYRSRNNGPNTQLARQFRSQYSREVPIHCIGIWDTVKALGIPLRIMERFNMLAYGFHDDQLSTIVRHGYHALAIDEHRELFKAELWSPPRGAQVIEQRWFPGAHADVGGGYRDRCIADHSYTWIRQCLALCGLQIADPAPAMCPPSPDAPITDSFSQFHKLTARWRTRYLRPIPEQDASMVLDPCVHDRLLHNAGYSPRNPGLLSMLQKDSSPSPATDSNRNIASCGHTIPAPHANPTSTPEYGAQQQP